MSILSALQSAALRLVGRRPTAFFGSSDQFEQELCDLATEVAMDIWRYRDWQALNKIGTITGNGGEEYDLPDDFGRMLLESDMQDTASWFWGYFQYRDINQFMLDRRQGMAVTPGGYIYFGDKLHFFPPPAGNAEFPYLSKFWAIGVDEVPKCCFTRDDDKFLLSERLLTLGLVWRWRENKGLDASGDQEAFIKALDEIATHEGGSRVMRYGLSSPFRGLNVGMAYPGTWR